MDETENGQPEDRGNLMQRAKKNLTHDTVSEISKKKSSPTQKRSTYYRPQTLVG